MAGLTTVGASTCLTIAVTSYGTMVVETITMGMCGRIAKRPATLEIAPSLSRVPRRTEVTL